MTEQRILQVGTFEVSNNHPFILMAGPCIFEGRDHALMMADALAKVTRELGIGFVYKSSFDKANRTNIAGFRGLGPDEALKVFAEIRDTFGCPVVTDVHEASQCAIVAEVVDILQIPAFLCRQTDLLLAAGNTGKIVNVKKGQFLAPWDVPNIVGKIDSTGNKQVMLCERGASFGYNTLVNDMRALPIMAQTGCPVIFDATHSVQQPGGAGTSTGGDRRFVPPLARAATAVGIAGLFLEVHENPDNAPSDGPNMIRLENLSPLLCQLQKIDALIKEKPVHERL